MRSLASILALISFTQGCVPKEESEPQTLPICGGILVALHITGGLACMNESVQISDHWQLSSVGRQHGWVRRLEPEEQKKLVKAIQHFESLVYTIKDDSSDGQTGVASTIIARGAGMGSASKKDATALCSLIEEFISVERIVSR